MSYPMDIDKIIANAENTMREVSGRAACDLSALPAGKEVTGLSGEGLRALAKTTRTIPLNAEVFIRRARNEGREPVKRLANAGLITHQDLNRAETDLDTLADHFIDEIQQCLKAKEADLKSSSTPYMYAEYVAEVAVDYPYTCPKCGTASTSCTDNSGRPTFKAFYMRCPCTEAENRRKSEELKLRWKRFDDEARRLGNG